MKAKRKLSELKTGEGIKINNRAEAKWAIRKFGFNETPLKLIGAYVIKSGDETYFWDYAYSRVNTYPASDFIKPKTKKWKEAFQEIARLDGRVSDLEKSIYANIPCIGKDEKIEIVSLPDYGTKEFVDMVKSSTKPHSTDCRNLHVKDEQVVSKTELTELPEKWCVKITSITLSYVNEHGTLPPYEANIGYYAHFPAFGNNYTSSTRIEDNYALISQSDFERLVLKNGQAEIIHPEEIDWSVPQLVQSDDLIIQTTGVNGLSTFSGVALTKSNIRLKGDYSDLWAKKYFKPLKGEITLKND